MKIATLALALAFGLLLPGQVHASGPAKASAKPANAPLVKSLLSAINHDRAIRGVKPLKLNVRLSQCSFGHSQHMASTNNLSHDQFPSDVCVRHTYAGENVGYCGLTSPNTVIMIHKDMMSEGPCPHRGCPGNELENHGHYLNLVDPVYHSIGLGVYVSHGTTWVTEDFTN